MPSPFHSPRFKPRAMGNAPLRRCSSFLQQHFKFSKPVFSKKRNIKITNANIANYFEFSNFPY
jgi:hypothetical protein